MTAEKIKAHYASEIEKADNVLEKNLLRAEMEHKLKTLDLGYTDEELKEMRESKELKGTISNFMDALTVTDSNPDPSITIECIDKGTIVLSLDRSAKDERCTNPECITCRGYDAVEGVVDRHLLSEKQKAERDAQALEEQKLRDPEGYKAFLKEKAQDDLAEDVDFEEI